MSNVVGYARVSRHDQNPAAQEAELRAAGAGRVFVDHGESSRVKDRPQWLACLDYLRPGDTLLVRRLDRLAGSEKMAIETITDLHERGVNIKSLTEPDIDTTTPMGRALFGIVAVFAPRIEDLRDRGVLREPGGDAPGALLLALHPQRECGKPTVQQVGPERVEESARDGPHAPQRLDRPFGPGDDAGDHVTVSAEVLRRAVQCHRRAQIDRVLQHGRRERVVHDDGDFSGLRDDGGDVDQLEGRIGGRLQHDEPGVVADARGDLVLMTEGDLGTEHGRSEQVIGAPVERPHRDDVGLSDGDGVRDHDGRHRRHARCEGGRRFGVLERRERVLEARDGRVPEARIDEAAFRDGPTAGRHGLVGVPADFDVGERIRRRQIDRRGVHAEGGKVVASGVDGERVEVPEIIAHGVYPAMCAVRPP